MTRKFLPDRFNALFAMTKPDPDAVGGAVDRIERRRAEGMARGSRRLARQKQLKPGVPARRAAHVLWLACRRRISADPAEPAGVARS